MTTRPPRVLVVVHAMASWQLELWRTINEQVELHTVTAASAPNVEGFPVAVQTPSFGQAHVLGIQGLLSRGHTWWRYQGLGALIRELRPDLLHLSSEPWGFLAQQGVHSHVPVVIHGAENIWNQGNAAESALRLALSRRALRHAAGFVSWNAEGIRLAAKHGLRPAAPTLVCPFVISPPAQYIAQRARIWERAAGAETLVIGYAGRLSAEKGLIWLVDGIAAARAQGTAARLEVAGAGTLRDELVRYAEAAKVPLTMLGALPTEELPDVMGSWDIAVVPSQSTAGWVEQFGRSAVEAMMCGLPVIVSDSGALPEVVGTAGRVVAEGDIAALASAIAGLADTEARRLVGKTGAAHVDETYGADVLATKVIDLWDRVLDGKARSGSTGQVA